MGSTAKVGLKITLTGLPEGGSDEILLSLLNTSGVGNSKTTVLSTVAVAGFVLPTSAKYLVLLPATSCTQTLFLTGSTSEVGITLSSRGASLLSVVGGSTLFCYSSPTTIMVRRIVL